MRLFVGGKSFTAWTATRVTRGVERMPGDFEIAMTDRYPGNPAAITVQPGQKCLVLLGDDPVINGYIDRVSPSISAGGHQITVAGRGKCQDLVDCSAILPGMALGGTGTQADAIIGPIAAKFGIDVNVIGSIAVPKGVPQFNINLGETPWDIIDRISRYVQVLCYEDNNGNLVLSRVGTTSMASGVMEGVNVEDASVTFSMDQRYSDYYAFTMSVDQFAQLGGQQYVAHVTDQSVPRYRPRAIISEQIQNDQNIAQMRLNWELARRIGQSQAVIVTVSGWRDTAGALWAPNCLLPVNLPSLKIVNQTMVIGDVTYTRGDNGTRAQLTLMPPAAYQPEPNVLMAIDQQVAASLPGGANNQ